MKTLAIIGAGDLGQQIAYYAISDKQYDKVVFFDDFTTASEVNGHVVLGTVQQVLPCFEAKAFDELLIGIGYKHLEVRKKLFEEFKNKIPFGILVHSTSWIDPSAKVASGCIIYPQCAVDAKSVIQENSVLNIGCTIAHDSVVGNHSFLSPRVAVAGFVTIQEQCIIGINSTIIDGISIAAKTQIGGGAVVIKSIENPGLYVGNPVKFIR